MADAARAKRIADRITQIVAATVDRRVKDPRLGFITITDCKVTSDLEHAKVYYTVFGSDQDRESSAAALQSAKGMIRSEVGKQLGIRVTPTLDFIIDEVPQTAAHIESALREAKEHDAEVRERATQAQYAGDADPYRKPRDLADDYAEPRVDASEANVDASEEQE